MNAGLHRHNAWCGLRRSVRLSLLIATFSWLTTAPGFAAGSVTIEWDQNTDSVTAGYYVYYGTEPGKYSTNVDVGKSTSAILSLTGSSTTYYFAVQAYSPTGERSPLSSELVWKTEASPQSPILRNPGSMTTVVGQIVNLQLTASDPGGLALSYTAAGLPAGLALGMSSGTISGIPTAAGAYYVTVTATNTNSLSASQTFTWTILSQPGSPGSGGTLPGGGGSGTGGGSTVSDPIAGGGGTGSGSGGGGGGSTNPTYPTEDRTSPLVNIVSPAPAGGNYRTISTKIILTGIASDNVGVVSVTWTNNRGGAGSALGTSSWATTPIDLQLGDNAITITASDAAGNAQTATVTVTRIVDLENYLN